ncbi:cytochrome-c peroxidase [Nostoc sp. DedQUE09]|uniref:cytochrome-c peroxidase n=1 Tax=Nostoc sp. DedQUE09 TaxID=3075394 RepID=UPI002AD39751|nr:cytochrome c peroxidase [Nostoc sp. DedQUE09]MDZ7953430.1 cytochrome c peroxidase [Nostoc sp. DedQUE09]
MIRSNTALAILIVLILILFWFYLMHKTRIISRYSRPLAIFVIVSVAIAGGGIVSAEVTPNPTPLNNITSLPSATSGDPTPANPLLLTAVAQPSNLTDFVDDQQALLKLGKALFWDMQLGSDGVQSCASCHFHAGTDNRSKNQISPGLLASLKDITFQVGGAANYQLTAADFPFHKLADPNDRTSTVISNTNDVASSQGVFYSVLKNTVPGQAVDSATSEPDPDGFQVNGINVRRVAPRNTPTVINAIFNKLQFWDGRAKETFNGVNIKGAADLSAKVYKATKPKQLTAVSVSLNNSSIASLVTGPLLSEFETSANGRTLPEVGAKFLRKKGQKIKSLRPLGKQLVDQQDSVLGSDSRFPRPGLKTTSYDQLIRKAFKKEWWKSKSIIQVDSNGTPTILAKNDDGNESEEGQTLPANQFSLRDWNFSLFSGLAVQKYISTLVSDNTPFDKFQAGNINALTAQEKSGLTVFVNSTANGGGNCNICHTIPEFTTASIRRTAGVASTDSTDPLINNPTNGFFPNYGVRPASDDPGAGNTTKSLFKAPSLRNIGLTAPYMHNGGMATLEQVVDFYNRGRGDDGGPGAGVLNLTDAKKADLVAFLRNGLTDQRVLLEQAPFDHPQLFIPNGHPGNQSSVTSSGNTNGTPTATDELLEIPAVGRNGVTTPKPNFLE